MNPENKTILFLQNGPHHYAPSRLDLRFAAAGLDVDYYWAARGEFPRLPFHYAGVLIDASPHGAYENLDWIIQEHRLIQDLAKAEIPMLGVCFGSQILASALCGRDQVFVRPDCEVGYRWIDLHPQSQGDELTRGLGDRVYMFVWHNDEVRAGHPDMLVLGSTDLCPNHIWRFKGLPVWGIQGHAELTQAQAREFFLEYREKLQYDGADVDALIESAHEAPQAKILVHNFIDFCTPKEKKAQRS